VGPHQSAPSTDTFRPANFLSRELSAYLIFSDRTPDFAVSGAIFPEYDFTGRKLQDLATPGRLDSLTFSALPFRTGGVIAFVWDSTRGTFCHQFLRSLDAIAPAGVPEALVRLTGQFENTLLDPRWWEGLSDSVRESLQRGRWVAQSLCRLSKGR
jgi:hypothetical protein